MINKYLTIVCHIIGIVEVYAFVWYKLDIMSNSTLIMDSENTDIKLHDTDELKEIASFIENKIVSADGLTLSEVFQVLLQMLNGDLELVKKVLLCAKIMVKNGMSIPKESQLTRADVLRTLQKTQVSIKNNLVKIPPTTPNLKSTTKKGKSI